MDPTTLTLLVTSVAGPILVALAHRLFPGAFGLQASGSPPAAPSQPTPPNSTTPATPPLVGGRHPLLQRLLGSVNGQGFLSELLNAAEGVAAPQPVAPVPGPAAPQPQPDATGPILAAILSSLEKRLPALETPAPKPS
jgi:hypothetical protein